ncbi:acyltransferase family protein [Microbacterium karelineae]|uniref:acyltransferase family protein n=1 Tax=Microbacterium karelineae TaxID=2654283 RepID=UPI0012E9E86C|nr:acyltransferase family protein [Microbacterium karelineae]
MLTNPPPRPQQGARIAWIDAARAVAVLAVILMHYKGYTVNPLGDYPSTERRVWREITEALTPIRMPLLLFISGMLASSKLLGSTAAAARRGISSLYLNGVWTTIYFLASFLLVVPSPGQLDSVWQWLRQLVLPGSNLWFVWALAAWAFAFILLKRLPMWLVLGGFLVLSMVGLLMRDSLPGALPSTFRYGLFFALGVYGSRYAVGFFSSAVATKAVVLLGIHVAAGRLAYVDGVDRFGRVLLIEVQSLAGLAAVSAVLVLLCRWGAFARVSGFIGKRTLPLFVCHLPLLWIVLNVDQVRAALSPAGFEWAWPILGTVTLAAGSLLIDFLARRLGARHLFDVPEALLPGVRAGGKR